MVHSNMLTKLITALAIVAAGLPALLVRRNEGLDNGVTVILVLLLITLAYNWLAAMLFRRLERNHPATYRELGEPRMLQRGSLRNHWTLMRFMFTAEHKALNDAMVSRLVIIMRALWVVTVGVIVFVATAERFWGFEARTKNHAITDTELIDGGIISNPSRVSYTNAGAAGFVVTSIEVLAGYTPPQALRTRNLLLNDTLPLVVEGDISLENIKVLYEQSMNNHQDKPPISSIRGSDSQATVEAWTQDIGIVETYYHQDDGTWSQNTPDATDRSTGIWGIVRKEKEERLANILVRVNSDSAGRGAFTTTDTNGEFFVSLPPGRYEISAYGRTDIPGYIVMGHHDYNGTCYHQVLPNQRTGPIEITYTRPVTVAGIRQEETLTADRRISWGCSYGNAQYRLELNQTLDNSIGELNMPAAVELGDQWRNQTSMVIPVSKLNPGWHSLYIWARDPVTKKDVSMMDGFLMFLVERPSR